MIVVRNRISEYLLLVLVKTIVKLSNLLFCLNNIKKLTATLESSKVNCLNQSLLKLVISIQSIFNSIALSSMAKRRTSTEFGKVLFTNYMSVDALNNSKNIKLNANKLSMRKFNTIADVPIMDQTYKAIYIISRTVSFFKLGTQPFKRFQWEVLDKTLQL